MNTPIQINDIIYVHIFLDRKKNRSYVGELVFESRSGQNYFSFRYDPQYLKRKYAISLGPELPLMPQIFQSAKLFPSFQDRIPSKENPAYPEYCRDAGISEQEKNPMILLSTIGKYGPSSFVFEMNVNEQFSANELKKYRKCLNLTIREFAALFSISPSHLHKVESKKFSGKEVLKLVEIYYKYPDVALDQIKTNSKVLHPKKYVEISNILKKQKHDFFLKNIEDSCILDIPKLNLNAEDIGLVDTVDEIANILTEREVEYTLSLIDKCEDPAWKNFLNCKNIKNSIESVKSYNLKVAKMDNVPKIEELSKRDVPTVIKTNKDGIWLYGSNDDGKPQLKQVDDEDSDRLKIKFLEKPYELKISVRSRGEAFFILQKYHAHFNNEKKLSIKALFFEIRFAYSIFSNELKAEYEFKTGVNKKSVDFKIDGNRTNNKFLVELASLRDSDRIKEEIKKNYGINLTHFDTDEEDSTVIKEAYRVQNVILEKSRKFPEIQEDSYHIIIIDVRGYQAEISDKTDYYHIIYGGEKLSDEYKIKYTKDGQVKLLEGIFEKRSDYFHELQKKIHAVGIIKEKNYSKNEIKNRIELYKNPFSITTEEETKILSRLFDDW